MASWRRQLRKSNPEPASQGNNRSSPRRSGCPWAKISSSPPNPYLRQTPPDPGQPWHNPRIRRRRTQPENRPDMPENISSFQHLPIHHACRYGFNVSQDGGVVEERPKAEVFQFGRCHVGAVRRIRAIGSTLQQIRTLSQRLKAKSMASSGAKLVHNLIGDAFKEF